jgi:radical SAM protein with 4Fe4S-binding SPASM domain
VPAFRIARLLREFVEMGGEAVSITGGEPLTHPHWQEIVAGACDTEGLERVELQTNATLIDGAALEFLRSLGPKKLTLRISLDGACEHTNDALRGTGTFAQSTAALDQMARAGLASQVILSLTETELNYPEIPELLELAERYLVPRVETATMLRRGRAETSESLAAPRPEQVVALIERYQRDEAFRRRYDAIGSTSALEWARWFPQPRGHYCNFIENPFVDVQGRLFPCAMYEREEAAVPGVFQRPLSDVLREGAQVWGRLRRLSRERIAAPGPCGDCIGWEHCRGGCFGRSVEASGDARGREDRCAQRRAVYGLRGAATPEP